jgi:hypothetical protein
MSFADEVKTAVEMLGGKEDEPVVDFLVDPGAACRALDAIPEHGAIVVRVAPEMGLARGGYAPLPVAPVWIRLMRGAKEIGTAQLREADGMVRRAERIDLDEHDEPCCDAPNCERKRRHASVWLVLEIFATSGTALRPPARLLVAEQRAEGEPAVAQAVATRLAGALGVQIHRAGVPGEIPPGEAPAPLGEGIAAASLARFAIRTEGDLVVVRDWNNEGPRASAVRNAWIGGALLLGAALAWYQLWRSIGATGTGGERLAAGAAGALLTLMGYAFVGVARFSAGYRAPCAPLLALRRDRLMVLPWVARDGAVDMRPEGRLGAAISLGEVRGARPRPFGEGVAVELDTEHGAIDAMVCPDARSADLWCAVLGRAMDDARHPRQGASARQRARQRAAA